MQTRYFHFDAFRNLLQPRKPRNPLVKLALGVLAVAILAVLVVVGVFVGAAMIIGGVMWKLLASRKKAPVAAHGNDAFVDAEYRVVRKAALPSSR